MKSLKGFFVKSIAAFSLIFAASFSSNAVLITQDIFAGGINIGTVSVEFSESLIGTGEIDTDFDGEPVLTSLEFFGFFPAAGVFDFFAVVDTDNMYAGIQLLGFDANDNDPTLPWSYQVYIDTAFPEDNVVDIFNDADALVLFAFGEDVFLGQATVVSAPAVIALFSLAIGGLLLRRRA
uniref:PEP-CTERM sorting domain-containing protein n=1 Tax=Ningiella ruwaisensis TaxID=2364274 RepID=UPI0010A0B072|nr:PEP-CTERM sorting domain-containing protein [Ningiella ruwaisensis]